MIIPDTNPVRLALPVWQPFDIAAATKEFHSGPHTAAPDVSEIVRKGFADALADFRASPSPFIATNLLGVATTIGEKQAASELAEFVSSQNILGAVALGFAQRVLGRVKREAPTSEGEHKLIKQSKKWVRTYNHDALAWLEQARLYTIIGQVDKAERSVDVAVGLAPENRYIVRSAVRFYVHCGLWEKALSAVSRALENSDDPWLYSQLINVGTHFGKAPNGLKKAVSNAVSAKDRYHFSELLEAFGTFEIVQGNRSTARRAFEHAWVNPAKTVVSHSSWVIRERIPELKNKFPIDYRQSAEAMMWVNFLRMDFDAAIQSGKAWLLEEPYASGPIIQCSFIEILRENYPEAQTIAEAGITSNPDNERLLNNLGVALIEQGKLDDANRVLGPIRPSLSDCRSVALLATWALLQMRMHNLTEGEAYFAKALEIAGQETDKALFLRTTMHYFMAKIEADLPLDIGLLRQTIALVGKHKNVIILFTGKMLLKRLEKLTGVTDAEITELRASLRQTVSDTEVDLKRAAG